MSDYWREPTDDTLPLFAARRADPATSKAAGEAVHASGTVGRHERAILDALALGPATKDEISARVGTLTEQQVARRMCGLRRAGLVVETGERRPSATGNLATVWRLG